MTADQRRLSRSPGTPNRGTDGLSLLTALLATALFTAARPTEVSDQQLLEEDWRKQDGLGTERAPSSYATAIALTLDRGDQLIHALQVAEMSDSGDGWDTVGYIHYVSNDYEEAAEAFQKAIDKGNLSNRSDTLLFLARALLELDDFEGAR